MLPASLLARRHPHPSSTTYVRRYVLEGRLSDPIGMNMYRFKRVSSTGLVLYRCVRTSSALEGSFQTYSRCINASSRASGPLPLTIRTFLFDLAWTINAAVEAHLMVDSGHHQPWLMDSMCSILSGYLREDELPTRYAKWRPIDMSRKPVTFRGYDFGMEAHRAEARRHKVCVSTLQEEEDIRNVLQYPELVLASNWAAILDKTGIRTNEKYLQRLKKRVLEKAATESALEGVKELQGSMQGTEGTADGALTRTLAFATEGNALAMGGQLAASDAAHAAAHADAQHGEGGDGPSDAAHNGVDEDALMFDDANEMSGDDDATKEQRERRRTKYAKGRAVRGYQKTSGDKDVDDARRKSVKVERQRKRRAEQKEGAVRRYLKASGGKDADDPRRKSSKAEGQRKRRAEKNHAVTQKALKMMKKE